MSDALEQMLAAQAGTAAQQPIQSGQDGRVVVSGLPNQEVDPIEAMLQQQASATTPAPVEQQIDPHAGEYGTMGNLGYGALKGLADMVHAPAQLALHGIDYVNKKLPGGGSESISNATNKFDTYLKNQEELYQLDTPGSVAAGVGRVGANIAPFLFTGGASAASQASSKAAQLAALMGKGAGASMATQPVLSGGDNFASDKLIQGALGAGGAGIGSAIGGIANKVLNPKFSPEVLAARAEGITPTIGQAAGGMWASLENKATSLPFLGDIIKGGQKATTIDFNKAAYNRALNPIGKNADNINVGHEGVEAVKSSLSDAYNTILPKLQFKGDEQLSNELTGIVQMVNNGNIPPTSASQFNSILKNNILSRMPNGSMDGKQFKALESDLGGIIKNKARTDPELAEALEAAMTSIRGGLSRSNPKYADELGKINKGYANYTRIRAAASGVGTDNGIFTPAQLANAVKSMDRSAGKGDSATGRALMQDLVKVGKNIAPTYPDSGTAGRAALIPSVLAAAIGGAANPVATASTILAGGAASLPYTSVGKKMAAAILMDRPDFIRSLGMQANKSLPLAGAPALGLTAQQLNSGN